MPEVIFFNYLSALTLSDLKTQDGDHKFNTLLPDSKWMCVPSLRQNNELLGVWWSSWFLAFLYLDVWHCPKVVHQLLDLMSQESSWDGAKLIWNTTWHLSLANFGLVLILVSCQTTNYWFYSTILLTSETIGTLDILVPVITIPFLTSLSYRSQN